MKERSGRSPADVAPSVPLHVSEREKPRQPDEDSRVERASKVRQAEHALAGRQLGALDRRLPGHILEERARASAARPVRAGERHLRGEYLEGARRLVDGGGVARLDRRFPTSIVRELQRDENAGRTTARPVFAGRRGARLVPSGATIHGETGEVTVNGVHDGHWSQAWAAPARGYCPSGSSSCGGYYSQIVADALKRDGLAREFNAVVVNMDVPSNPIHNDGQHFGFFPGLQNYFPDGSVISIMQPVLGWGKSEYLIRNPDGDLADIESGGKYWHIHAEVNFGGLEYPILSEYLIVNPHDRLQATISRTIHGTPHDVNSDLWAIVMDNMTTGQFVVLYWNPPSWMTKYTQFILGALEAYGDKNNSLPLVTCGLPPGPEVQSFTLLSASQGSEALIQHQVGSPSLPEGDRLTFHARGPTGVSPVAPCDFSETLTTTSISGRRYYVAELGWVGLEA